MGSPTGCSSHRVAASRAAVHKAMPFTPLTRAAVPVGEWGQSADFFAFERVAVEDLHLLNDLGWDETIDGEQVTLTVPPRELVRAVARSPGSHRGAGDVCLAAQGRGGPGRALQCSKHSLDSHRDLR